MEDEYCKLARKVLGREIKCGTKCPIVNNCPQIILEDAVDEGVERAMEALLQAYKLEEK